MFENFSPNNYKVRWCHGIGPQTHSFSEKEKGHIIGLIQLTRIKIDSKFSIQEFESNLYAKETRYYDDCWVYNYIQSANTEGYEPSLDELILDALMGCAGADYWYKYEKDWR